MKLLIAEDEKFERNALEKIINKYYPGIYIFSVSNGRDALDIAQKYKPEIICLDIQMPFINGMSVATKIREINSRSKIIMLTANDSFSSAQEAIHIGIDEYILKPYSVKTLRFVLDQMVNRFEYEKMTIDEENNKVHKLLKNELMHKILVNSRLKPEIIKNYIDLLNLEDNFYRIVIIYNDYQYNNEKKAEITLEKNKKILYMDSSFANAKVYIFYSVYKNKLKNLILLKNSISSDVLSNWNFLMKEMNKLIKIFLKKSEESYEPIDILENKLIENIIKNDTDEFYKNIEDIVNSFFYLYGPTNDMGYAIINLYEKIQNEIYHKIYDKKIEDNMQKKIEFSIPYKGDTVTARKELYDLCCIISKSLQYLDQNNNKILIREVKKYIRTHYSENITLDDIQSQLNISKYHLSRIFKKETGDSIINYLQIVRVERSKSLLLQGLSITEICYKCGFSDAAYFSKIFKKITKKTPTQFKLKQ